jgi:hypothetical protein
MINAAEKPNLFNARFFAAKFLIFGAPIKTGKE